MNLTDKRITDIEKRIDDIEKFNKDKLDQTMIKFEHVLNYVDSIDFEFAEFKKRIAELETKFSDVFSVKDEIENKLQKIADDNHLVLKELEKRIAKLEQTVHFDKDDTKVEVPELPNILEPERIKFLSLLVSYHSKIGMYLKPEYALELGNEFFKEVCLIFREEK